MDEGGGGVYQAGGQQAEAESQGKAMLCPG
jgi:hypothetical protein